MIVYLIPLLIFARIAVNETDWKYGPEVIYDIKVDSTSRPYGQLQKPIGISNMTMKLKCRSKLDDVLSCHFFEPKVIISTIRNFGKPKIFKDLADVKEENIGDDIFELKYFTDDIEKIVISSSIKEHKLDMIRALVVQLSLGAGIWAFSKHELFERFEKSTIGWCSTDYLATKGYVNDDEIKEEENSYEIDTWPHGLIDKGEIKEIQRTRNIDKCKHHINYFFGSREIPKNSSIKIETEIKTSKSHMTVGRRIFNSYTENSIIVNTNIIDISTALTERITLSLEKIVPASGPLPTISDPSSFDIFPTKRN